MIFALIVLSLLFCLNLISATVDWTNFHVFDGSTAPYASNGPGCHQPGDKGGSAMQPGQGCFNDNNPAYDLGAIWVDMYGNQSDGFIAWKLVGPFNQNSSFCNSSGSAVSTFMIEFDSDNNESTGCSPGGNQGYNGADYKIVFENGTGVFKYYNASNTQLHFTTNASVNVTSQLNCSSGMMKFAIPRNAVTNLRGMRFQANTAKMPPTFSFQLLDSLGSYGDDKVMMNGQQDMMFQGQHPCNNLSQNNCNATSVTSQGNFSCHWDSVAAKCFPSMQMGGAGMTCSDFCGACSGDTNCTNGAKGKCKIISAPSMGLPSNAITWNSSGLKMCVEDPTKFMFGGNTGGGSCDSDCKYCYSNSTCSNSIYPNPSGTGSGCKWVVDTQFNQQYCVASTFNSDIAFTCSSSQLDRCFNTTTCTSAGGNWSSSYNICMKNGTSQCWDGAHCSDAACQKEKICGGDINVLTGGFGTLDPMEAMKKQMFSGMDMSPPVMLATAPQNNTLPSQIDILGFQVKDMGEALGMGIGIRNMSNTTLCNALGTGKYYYFLDVDNNQSTGCNITLGSTYQGFDYRFEYEVENNGTNGPLEIRRAYRCVNNNFSLYPAQLAGAPDQQFQGIGQPTKMSCMAQSAMIAVDKSDIGNPFSTIRFMIASSGNSTNYPYINDSLINNNGMLYTPGTIDQKPIDCSSNPMACGTAFSVVGGGKFMPHERCDLTSQTMGIDANLNGLVGCSDPDCMNEPRCSGTNYTTGATSAPTLIDSKAESFGDFVNIHWISDQPAIGNISFYNNCMSPTASNLFNLPGYMIFKNIGIKNGMNDANNNTINITSGNTYFYKITVCNVANLCGTSACLNFTAQAPSSAINYQFNFVPPQNAMVNTTNFKLWNGTAYENINKGQTMNKSNYLSSGKLLFDNPQNSWSIELNGVDLAKAVSFNLTNSFNVSNSSGKTYVGLDPQSWTDMAQNLGVSNVTIKIPGTGNKLMKCSETNTSDCSDASSSATLLETNLTGGYTKWSIPTTLGFSSYTVQAGASPGNQSSENSSEWWMFHEYLNHTSWDGVSYTTISGLNNASFTTGARIYMSSPAVANGYVYIGSDDYNIYQLNASNVSQRIANYTTGSYIQSSPAVANGYLYVGSVDNRIYQLNATNVSQKIANYTPGVGTGIISSPAVANGYVYFGIGANRIYQLNASNVSQLITYYTTGIATVVTSSPAVANGYVYVQGGDIVYQLNASDISQLIASYSTGATSGFESSPAVANGYLYVGSGTNVYQLNASNVSIKIANYTTRGDVVSSPAVANGYLYIGSEDNRTYQLNATNISIQIASYTTSNQITFSSPAVAGGYLYIGSKDNRTYQLNASNVSQLIAYYATGGSIESSPAVANGYVYIGSDNGKLYQLNATNISLTDSSSSPGTSNLSCNSSINSPGTYTLTGDLINCSGTGINIIADNVVLDCNSHQIKGLLNGNGIYSIGHNNLTIENCLISNFTNGISFESSSGINITNNTIHDNFDTEGRGIVFTSVGNSSITHNNISQNSAGIYLYDSSNNLISNNLISFNNQIGSYGDGSDDLSGIEDFLGSNNTISQNVLQDNKFMGVYLVGLNTGDVISNNSISSVWGDEIVISNARDTTNITDNVLFGKDATTTVGLWSQDSNVTFSRNKMCGNNNGLQDWRSGWADNESGYLNASGYTLVKPVLARLDVLPSYVTIFNSSGSNISSGNIVNESGYVNSTGYVLTKSNLPGFAVQNLSVANNSGIISSGNYTLNEVTNTITSFGTINNESGYINSTGYILNKSNSNMTGLNISIENINVLNASGAVISSGNYTLNESTSFVSSGTIIKERNGYINASGYALANLPQGYNVLANITEVLNASDNEIISPGNYTFNQSTNKIYNSTPAVWDDVKISYSYEQYALNYVLYNSTATVWNNLNISYNYSYKSYTPTYVLYSSTATVWNKVNISYNYSYNPFIFVSNTANGQVVSYSVYNTTSLNWNNVNITYFYDYLPENFDGFTITNNSYCIVLNDPVDGYSMGSDENNLSFIYDVSNKIAKNFSDAKCYLYLDDNINDTKDFNSASDYSNWVDEVPLSSGSHTWYVRCNDSYGNNAVSSTFIITGTASTANSTVGVSTQAGGTTSINRTDTGMDVGLDLTTKANEDANLVINEYSSAPAGGSTFALSALGKYVAVTSDLVSLDYGIIKIYYSDSELTAAGLNEDSLRLEYYNASSGTWHTYDSPEGGVDTANNYVWANTTHFSLFGVFGTLTSSGGNTGGNTGSGGGGGGGSSAKKSNATSNQVTTPTSTTPTTGNIVNEQTTQSNEGNEGTTPELPSKKPSSAIFWVIGIIILLGAIGTVVYLVLKRRRY